jgi:hypothetical protein
MASLALAMLVGCGGGGGGGSSEVAPPIPVLPIVGPAWWNFGRDAQHSAISGVATQPLNRIVWQTRVDLVPTLSPNGSLLIHYGSPVITARNTVLVPVKIAAPAAYRVEARSGTSGSLSWSFDTDYVMPPFGWLPSYNIALTQGSRLYFPGAGGKLYFRDDPDNPAGTVGSVVFYGNSVYEGARTQFNSTVMINTPLTIDTAGNVFFGFVVTGTNPAGLTSGIARVTPGGVGTWVSARTASGNAAIGKPAMTSAPALSNDQATLYVSVATTPPIPERPSGMLLALDAQTLATKGTVELRDPKTGALSWISDNSTASPTVGPDGDVYYGVLEADTPNHNFRGWLLHYDATLTQTRTPGSFGWDDTVSIVPTSMVPQYTGPSSYLLAVKYNNYAGVGTGDGRNKMAIIDPRQSQIDAIAPTPVMREILTIVGPTAAPGPPGSVSEWCINTVAVDPLTNSLMVNSEDGQLYRWHLPSNSFTEKIRFNNGYFEAYTPTAVGPDGIVYAINNSVLFAVGR